MNSDVGAAKRAGLPQTANGPPVEPEEAPLHGLARRRLGRGQSGEVWLTETPEGLVATKVFVGGTLGNLIHYILTGAPNPYIWNEDAARAAFERRKILHDLIPVWFGDRLAMSDAVSVSWNTDSMTWELGTRYAAGSTVPLVHPFRPHDALLDVLVRDIMKPFHARLVEAGFIGTAWQAGKGNPVALNNFLLTAPGRFTFIDAESGIPAIGPLDPVAMLTFYLPQSLRMRRMLFDDVDVGRLRHYLDAEAAALAATLGQARLQVIRERTERLADHQARWRGMRRTERAIAYHRSKGRITGAEAEHFLRNPWQWHRREARRAAARTTRWLSTLPARLPPLLRRLRLRAGEWAGNLRRFVTSQEYRTEIGRRYVEARIATWQGRGQLAEAEATMLRQDLGRTEETGSYISDFGAHLGMRATFLAVEVFLLGLLGLLGVPLLVLAAIFVLDGPIYRSLYTLWRGTTAVAAGKPPPWVAFLVGLLPLFGSLAFPVQMVWSARGEKDDLARFIVCDSFTRVGEKLPMWNGRDSLVEHRMNRLGMAVAGASSRWRVRRMRG